MSVQEIHNYISECTEIRIQEKDKYGEVFTPPKLINELLDALPTNVWKNPNARWLDPAAGRGFFTAIVYIRLLDSLQSVFPDETKRKRHILDNMLFMVELNPSSVKHLREWFGTSTHISCADFLKWKNLQLFDVVLGNPPFQKEKMGKYEGGVGHRTLWDKFVVASLDILTPYGQLAFITPSGWRRPESNLYEIMVKQNQLNYLHIYGKSAGRTIFGAETRFDLYVITKSENCEKKETTIVDEQGKIHKNIRPDKWPFLPNYAYPEIKKILVQDRNDGIPILFHAGEYDARKLSKNKSSKYHYPVVHGITQKGLGLRYAKNRNSDQFGIPKVLLNFNERQYPYNDFAGKYGMSQLTFAIPINTRNEGESWIKAIESPAFEHILRATKWGAFQTDYRMFRHFDKNLWKYPEFRSAKNKTLKIRK